MDTTGQLTNIETLERPKKQKKKKKMNGGPKANVRWQDTTVAAWERVRGFGAPAFSRKRVRRGTDGEGSRIERTSDDGQRW